jgi:hypothetical protein
LSSTGATFKATGGGGRFTLYMSGSCATASISATTSASWVNVGSMLRTSRGVKVSYSVAQNTGVAREARIEIAGKVYKVKQLAAKAVNPNKPVKTNPITIKTNPNKSVKINNRMVRMKLFGW